MIGVVGVLLLLVGLFFDDLLAGFVPESDWLSMVAIATFLAAFGFGAYFVDSRTGLPTAVAASTGAAAGFGLGFVAMRWSRSLAEMATDATPTASDLAGCEGRVVTPIPPRSTGEVLVSLAGQPVKLTAVAGHDQIDQIDQGTSIVVVRVLSSTRVEVEAADSFWGRPGELGG